MKMIFDCFMFSHEFEILELRLLELYDVVDRFVIVEATKTHRGLPKPLHFAEQRERFAPYLDKIVHVVVDDMPDNPDPFAMDAFQRGAIVRGLYEAHDDDFIIIGDLDEIPRANLVRELRDRPQDIVGFQMILSCFKYNYVCMEGETQAVWSVAARARHVRRLGTQYFRDKRLYLHNVANAGVLLPEFVVVLPHAGWHFGWIGDHEAALRKLQGTPHQEHNTAENVAALVDIDAIIQSGRDLFQRPGYRWAPVQLNDYFPETLRNNLEKYAPHIVNVQ